MRVMYCIVKKMSEGSGVKPLFLCVKIFVSYFYHFHATGIRLIMSLRVSLMNLLMLFYVLGPYSPQFNKVCIQNGHSVWLFVNGQTIFLKNPVDCLV